MKLPHPGYWLLAVLLSAPFWSFAGSDPSDTASGIPESVMVLPYMPMMHLSDADQDISVTSGMTPNEVRELMRLELLKDLQADLKTDYSVRIPSRDFVLNNSNDMENLYHVMYFNEDTVYPVKYPVPLSKEEKEKLRAEKTERGKAPEKEKKYINVGMYDQKIFPDLAHKYNADYFIFLNELDIKTRYDDCMDLALKIYRRDLKVHYSVFDRTGKQVYGDVAVAHFASNSNDVKEIMNKNYPVISGYILHSLKNRHE